MSISSSSLAFDSVYLFRRERYAERFKEDYEDTIDEMGEDIEDNADDMSKKEREAAERFLDVMKGFSVRQKGEMVRVKGSYDREDLEEMMH
jgi:hypothetical protein